jgi:hypothetical protein
VSCGGGSADTPRQIMLLLYFLDIQHPDLPSI